MIDQQISPIPTPPSRSDPTNFNQRADDFLAHLPTLQQEMNTFGDQANALADEMNAMAQNASNSENIAMAAANFKGEWDANTTYVHPSSVVKNGTYYLTLQDSTGQDPESTTGYWSVYRTPAETDIQGYVDSKISEHDTDPDAHTELLSDYHKSDYVQDSDPTSQSPGNQGQTLYAKSTGRTWVCKYSDPVFNSSRVWVSGAKIVGNSVEAPRLIDEIAKYSMGNVESSIVTNSVSPGTYDGEIIGGGGANNGLFGRCTSFLANAVEYFKVPDLPLSNEMSLSVWVRPTVKGDANLYHIFHSKTLDTFAFMLHYNTTTGEIILTVRSAAVIRVKYNFAEWQWHNFTVVMNNTRYILYANGVPIGIERNVNRYLYNEQAETIFCRGFDSNGDIDTAELPGIEITNIRISHNRWDIEQVQRIFNETIQVLT